MAKKKLLSGLIFFGIGVALIAGLLFKIDIDYIAEEVLSFSWGGFLLIVALTFLANVIGNFRAWLILRYQDIDIPFWHLLFIWLAGNAFNYTTPFVYVGGEGVKAYLLNDKYDVPWRKSTSMLIFDRMLELTASFVVIIISLTVFVSISGASGLASSLISAMVGISILAIIFFLVYFRIFRNKKIVEPVLKFLSAHNTRIGKFLRKAEYDMIGFFDHKSNTMWYAWGLSILKQVIILVRHIYLIFFLTGQFHFIASAIALGMLYIGFMVPIPASLGVQEVLQGIGLALFGFTAGQGLALSVVLRGADIIMVALGLIVILKYGLGLIADSARRVLQFNNNGPEEGSENKN
ncbi:MAG: lysylphosphatidylglycerol synthase transmembrane domain-containing protein [Candidatus Spechtbacterales bacterium]|nr:lysylphosphatidylglycerol synthase transmembrane domain-containing protein [Candidatus Spechtbacterales bacterium]